MDKIVNIMSEHNTSQTYNREMISALFIIRHLSMKYPYSFAAVSKKPVHQPIRLDPYQTSALIDYCDLTNDTAYNKLNKFILHNRNVNLLCPKRDLARFKVGAPIIKTLSCDVECNTKKEKKTQTADCVITTMHDNIRNRLQRYLGMSPILFDVAQPREPSVPMFGYLNPGPPNDKTVLGVIGTDHGQHHSQFQLSLHLLPSSTRREKQNKAFGILEIPFSTIKCTKENSNILQLTAPSINQSIGILEKCKLMGVICGVAVHCFWIHKLAQNIQIHTDLPCRRRVCYKCEGSTFTQCLPEWCQSSNIQLSLITVMAPLHFIVVCDISAMFALMGREGHSTSTCLKCDLKASEWKADSGKVGLELTKEMLETMLANITVKKINKAGMKRRPLFNLPPSRYLCPLLHLLLGLINDIMMKAIVPFALCMDGCCDVELAIREKLEMIFEMPSRTRISLQAQLKKLIKKRTSKCQGTDMLI